MVRIEAQKTEVAVEKHSADWVRRWWFGYKHLV